MKIEGLGMNSKFWLDEWMDVVSFTELVRTEKRVGKVIKFQLFQPSRWQCQVRSWIGALVPSGS